MLPTFLTSIAAGYVTAFLASSLLRRLGAARGWRQRSDPISHSSPTPATAIEQERHHTCSTELSERVRSDALKRPGFAGGSTFQIGWSHDEQDDDEQIFT